MRELTPEEAHVQYMAQRRTRVADLIEPTVAEKERREAKQRELIEGVNDMCRAKRRFHGPGPSGGVDAPAPAPVSSTASNALPAGWKDLHWKQQQSLLRDMTGSAPRTKAAIIAALEAYDASMHADATE